MAEPHHCLFFLDVLQESFCLSVAFLLSLNMKELMLVGAKLFYYISMPVAQVPASISVHIQ